MQYLAFHLALQQHRQAVRLTLHIKFFLLLLLSIDIESVAPVRAHCTSKPHHSRGRPSTSTVKIDLKVQMFQHRYSFLAASISCPISLTFVYAYFSKQEHLYHRHLLPIDGINIISSFLLDYDSRDYERRSSDPSLKLHSETVSVSLVNSQAVNLKELSESRSELVDKLPHNK
jgi:hypothetical protein